MKNIFKTKLKVGDTVKVISGAEKFRGETGTITRFGKEKQRVFLEGVKVCKKHIAPQKSAIHPEGGIVEIPGSFHISNVMFMCTENNRPVKLSRKVTSDGKKVRLTRGSKVKAVEVV